MSHCQRLILHFSRAFDQCHLTELKIEVFVDIFSSNLGKQIANTMGKEGEVFSSRKSSLFFYEKNEGICT